MICVNAGICRLYVLSFMRLQINTLNSQRQGSQIPNIQKCFRNSPYSLSPFLLSGWSSFFTFCLVVAGYIYYYAFLYIFVFVCIDINGGANRGLIKRYRNFITRFSASLLHLLFVVVACVCLSMAIAFAITTDSMFFGWHHLIAHHWINCRCNGCI